MKFQTQIPLKQQTDKLIDYQSNVLLLGSCFVENIGEKFSYYKFKSLQNPLGILFSPKAIETLVNRAIRCEKYTETELFFHNEQWHCFDAHSKISHSNSSQVLTTLNTQIEQTTKQIKKATHVVITLGTAWVYQLKRTQTSVANCHKVPQNQFNKKLLQADEVLQSLKAIVTQILNENPAVSVIFTVSPVRHIKDGFVENNQSKAHLLTAVHQLIDYKNVFYFPSYEIMMDELRDYRFYADDMLHPSTVAINYIWDKFCSVWLSQTAQQTMQMVADIQKGLQHKPFNPDSEAHQKFLKNIQSKQKQLQLQFPHIRF